MKVEYDDCVRLGRNHHTSYGKLVTGPRLGVSRFEISKRISSWCPKENYKKCMGQMYVAHVKFNLIAIVKRLGAL